MSKLSLIGGIFAASLILLTPGEASSQLIPQPWVSVGGRDGDTTFSVGARALNLGAELGLGPNSSTGVDGLLFLNLPLVNQISPYVGLGYYSNDEGIAVSGGVQLNPTQNLIVGGGYNSVRGINGQIGVRF